MFMDWKGVTPDQYEQVRAIAKWDVDYPKGGMFHLATFDDDGMHIFDIWESPAAFEAFGTDRLNAAVQEVGITTEPQVRIAPVHGLFIPSTDNLVKIQNQGKVAAGV
jgi:hypothetical protein